MDVLALGADHGPEPGPAGARRARGAAGAGGGAGRRGFAGLLGLWGLLRRVWCGGWWAVKAGACWRAARLWRAALLTVCDVAARTLFAPYELPVGVVLSLAGGLFFLWLLFRKARGHP